MRIILFFVLALLSDAAHATPRCAVPAGWSRVVGPQAHFVVFGETHGTTESPTLFGDTVCALAARHQRVLVAVELSGNAGLQRAWSGPHAGFATMLATEMPEWTTRNDGVTSRAMLAMLVRLHALKEAGAAIDIVAFNDTGVLEATRFKDLPGQGPHEAGQAENIRAADALHPYGRVLVLVGNYHARKKPLMRRGTSYNPMAMRLAEPARITSLYLATGAGDSWFCAMKGVPPAGVPITSDMVQCGAHRVSADVDWSGPARIIATPGTASPGNPDGAYDGTLFVGPVTASPPAMQRK